MNTKRSERVATLEQWVTGKGWGRRPDKWNPVQSNRAALKPGLPDWRGWTLLGLVPLLAGLVYQVTAAAHELRKYVAPGKLIDIGGRRLHLQIRGGGSPTVVLEAAGFGCSVDFDAIQSELARFTRVCAYDRAGMGWSDPCREPRSIRELVDDLRNLLRTAGIGPPYLLVGASAGGLIAELFARSYPEEVAGLVLIDALDEETLARLPRASAHLMKRVPLGQLCARLGILSLFDPFELKKLPLREGSVRSALTYRSAPWTAARSFLNTLARSEADLRAAPPLRPDLPLTVLTHGLIGDLLGPRPDPELLREVEPIWQSLQSKIADRSSRGKQVIAAQSGHRIIAQQPELVVEAVREAIELIRKE